MLILYRFLSIILNVFALMLAISLLMTLPLVFSSPLNMLSAFLIISIILYAWFSNKFSRTVLQQQLPVKKSLKDWIRVNGIVAVIYSVLVIFASSFLLLNSNLTSELVKNIPADMPIQESDLVKLFVFMLVFASLLLLHVILTFSYMKKNSQFFVDQE